MDYYNILGDVMIIKTKEEIPIYIKIDGKDLYIKVKQRGKQIEFKLNFWHAGKKKGVFVKKKVEDPCLVSQEILIDKKFNSDHYKQLGFIDLHNNYFSRHKEANLKKSAEMIIVEICKFTFMNNGWRMPKDKLILEIEDGKVERVESQEIGTNIDQENYNQRNYESKREVKHNIKCNDCIKRNDCFQPKSNKIECDHYKQGPTRIPTHWPRYMSGPY